MPISRARLLAVSAAAVAAVPAAARGQVLEKIRFAGVPTDDLTPVFYAIRNGFYRQAGLDVEFAPTSSGTAATTAVVAGAYEMGKGSLIASLVAHLRGLPLSVVGHGVLWDPRFPFSLHFVAADSPLRRAADLNGKTAATAALNDLSQLALNAWMDKNGGDVKSLKWVEVPNAAIASSLEQGRIDVAGMNEPQVSAARESGKLRVLAPCHGAIADHFVIAFYFANTAWAVKHPDAVKRWVRVTYEAAAYTNAHRAETETLMAEMTKMPLETIRKIARGPGATSTDPAMVQPAIEAAAKCKNIERAFPAKDLYFTG